jgi:hypothetical protein
MFPCPHPFAANLCGGHRHAQTHPHPPAESHRHPHPFPAPAILTAAAPVDTPAPLQAEVIAPALNVRTGPGLAYPVLARWLRAICWL